MNFSRRERIGCEGFHKALRADAISRRGLLKAGVISIAGLSLSQLLRSEAAFAAVGGSPKKLNSVIILWMRGGPAQHETWDGKNDSGSVVPDGTYTYKIDATDPSGNAATHVGGGVSAHADSRRLRQPEGSSQRLIASHVGRRSIRAVRFADSRG